MRSYKDSNEMLTISDEQLAHAEVKYRIRFYKRIRAYVREKMPEETYSYSDSKFLIYIAEQDKIAAAHGIKTEQGLVRWVSLSLWVRQDFYQQPDFKDYFKSSGEAVAETRLVIYMDYIRVLKNNPETKIENSLYQNNSVLKNLKNG